MKPPDLQACLAPTRFLDCDAPELRDYAARATAGAGDARARAVALFYAVRDGIRYDPYSVKKDPEAYVASRIAREPATFCVPKAILLAAAARAVGIPARLGFADVRNHLSSEKLRARMGTDLFVFHGYTELHLDVPRSLPKESDAVVDRSTWEVPASSGRSSASGRSPTTRWPRSSQHGDRHGRGGAGRGPVPGPRRAAGRRPPGHGGGPRFDRGHGTVRYDT